MTESRIANYCWLCVTSLACATLPEPERELPAAAPVSACAAACSQLAGTTFAAKAARLQFTTTGFEWYYEDVTELGRYRCESGSVLGTTVSAEYRAPFSADCMGLVWEGVEYRRRDP